MDAEVSVPSCDVEWEALIEAWVAAQESEKQRSDDDSGWWAADAVDDWRYAGKHAEVWEFITRAFDNRMSDTAFAILAAGPLEEFLADFGELYIDRVEELARKNPRFNDLLGGVWKNAMADNVWTRVQNARLKVW
jgi:hypothetical protein